MNYENGSVGNGAGKNTTWPASTTTATTTTTTTTTTPPENEGTTHSVAVTSGTGDKNGQGIGDQDSDDENIICKPVDDGRRRDYIEKNYHLLKRRCQKLQKCTDELYSAENFLDVLEGKPIQLSNMCGLLYKDPNNGYGELGDKCSEGEREAIRQNLSSDLLRTLTSSPEDSIRTKLRRCLSRGGVSEDEKLVNGLCRLKVRSMNETRLGYLCQDRAVDQFAQDFFNQKLEHLHCSCEAVTARESTPKDPVPFPPGAKIGTGVGLGFIVLFVIIVYLFRRGEKYKRQLSRMQPDREEPNFGHSVEDSGSVTYQEIDCASQDFPGMAFARSLVQSAGPYEPLVCPPNPENVNDPVTSQVQNNPTAGGIPAAQNQKHGSYICMEHTKRVYVNVDEPPVTYVEIKSENDTE